ncbi:MAG TPA: cytochrome c [Lacunisphaera sp.]|nr:cytochrome c [Lacunisphaera sp.]
MKQQRLLVALLFCGSIIASSAADPKSNWKEHCAKCHGADGKGNTRTGRKLAVRDLTDPKVHADFTDEQAIEVMKSGLMNDKGKVTMKPVKGLSDEEYKALVPYLRSLKR